MIYFFNASDAHSGAREFVRDTLRENPGSLYARVDDENWEDAAIEEIKKVRGIFGGKYVVFFDRILNNSSAKETVLKHLSGLRDSQNIFVFFEQSAPADAAEMLSGYSEKTRYVKKELPGGREKKKQRNMIFELTNAVGKKDKRLAWTSLRRNLLSGASPEEITSMLFWLFKSIIAAGSSETPKDAGLTQFVFNKSVNFSKKYARGEPAEAISRLLAIYHESRAGKKDLGAALELFILRL